jgi:hypothetical protein
MICYLFKDLCDNLNRLSIIPQGWPAKDKLTVWLNLLSGMQVRIMILL